MLFLPKITRPKKSTMFPTGGNNMSPRNGGSELPGRQQSSQCLRCKKLQYPPNSTFSCHSGVVVGHVRNRYTCFPFSFSHWIDTDGEEAPEMGTASTYKEPGILNHHVEETHPLTKTLDCCMRQT